MEHDKDLRANDPAFADALSELQDHGIQDVVQLYTLGEVYVATMGSLGRDRAKYLLEYTCKTILTPFGLMQTGRSVPSVEETSTVAVSEVDAHHDGQPGQPIIKEEECEVVLKWLVGVQEDCETSEIEDEVDELDETESETESETDDDVERYRCQSHSCSE
jgi:hypothetical protein